MNSRLRSRLAEYSAEHNETAEVARSVVGRCFAAVERAGVVLDVHPRTIRLLLRGVAEILADPRADSIQSGLLHAARCHCLEGTDGEYRIRRAPLDVECPDFAILARMQVGPKTLPDVNTILLMTSPRAGEGNQVNVTFLQALGPGVRRRRNVESHLSASETSPAPVCHLVPLVKVIQHSSTGLCQP